MLQLRPTSARGVSFESIVVAVEADGLLDVLEQVQALEEDVPYQTLIASVLHRYVSGRMIEKAAVSSGRATAPRKRPNLKR